MNYFPHINLDKLTTNVIKKKHMSIQEQSQVEVRHYKFAGSIKLYRKGEARAVEAGHIIGSSMF